MNSAGGVVLGIMVIIIVSLLLAFPAMWLWNWALVPAVSILNPITSVWKMWGIMILSSWLFKSSNYSKS